VSTWLQLPDSYAMGFLSVISGTVLPEPQA